MLNSAGGKCACTARVPLRFFCFEERNMMGCFQDLSGQKFGRLTVIKRASDYVSPSGNKLVRYLCLCDCGNEIFVLGGSLKKENTKSCGCLQRELAAKRHTKHNKYGCRLYHIWIAINQRCYNPNSTEYNIYGGRGITVCDEWRTNFQAFYDWSMANGYRDDLTIDRQNGAKGYSPDNCKWATMKEQANNTRRNNLLTYNGKTQTLAQWAEEIKANYSTLWSRIYVYHWSIEKALTTKCNR